MGCALNKTAAAMPTKQRAMILIVTAAMICWGCYGGYKLYELLQTGGEWASFSKSFPRHRYVTYESDPLNFIGGIIVHLFEITIGCFGVYRALIYYTTRK
jgi:hypothetical protein